MYTAILVGTIWILAALFGDQFLLLQSAFRLPIVFLICALAVGAISLDLR